MKKLITLITLILSFVSYSQKASLSIKQKNLFKNVDFKISKEGYICTLEKNRKLKIYEPTNLKLTKEYLFDFDVYMDYVSSDASFIKLEKYSKKTIVASKGTKKLLNSSVFLNEKDNGYFSLTNGESFNKFEQTGQLKTLIKNLKIKDNLNEGMFFINKKQINIVETKSNEYYILSTDLITNKTEQKKLVIPNDFFIQKKRRQTRISTLSDIKKEKICFIVNYDSDGFVLMNRKYKNNYTQNTILLNYNYNGELISTKNLINEIDPKMNYSALNSYSFPVSSYYANRVISSTTVGPYEIAKGYYSETKNTNNIFTYSLIHGIKKKDGAKLLVTCFDDNGTKKWTKNIVVSEKRGQFKTGGPESFINFSSYNDKICISISNTKEGYIKSFVLNSNTGEVLQSDINFEYNKQYVLFTMFRPVFTYTNNHYPFFGERHTKELILNNVMKVKSISKEHKLSADILTFYSLDETFKNFIDGYNTESEYKFISSKNDSNIYILALNKEELNISKF